MKEARERANVEAEKEAEEEKRYWEEQGINSEKQNIFYLILNKKSLIFNALYTKNN